MLKEMKEAVLYPVSDPNWARAVGRWWLCYLLAPLIPLLFHSYQQMLKQSIEDPERESLPPIEFSFQGWLSGLCFLFTTWAPAYVGGFVNMGLCGVYLTQMTPDPTAHHPPVGFMIFFFIHVVLVLLNIIFTPALLLQISRKEDSFSVFRFREVWSIVRAAPVEYAALLLFPFLGALTLWVCAVTIVGLIFVIPALPIFVLGHARYLGAYARRHLTDC